MRKTNLLAIALLSSAALFACASRTDTTAPDVVDDALDTETVAVTSRDGTVTWYVTANAPVKNTTTTAQASATITGTVGSVNAAGVCLLKRTNTPCTPSGSTDVATDQAWLSQASQCGTKPYSNGYWYCHAQGSDTSPTCAIRPGTRSQFCVGTPKLQEQYPSTPSAWSFSLPSSPYTLLTPSQTLDTGAYYSYACPGGCEASDGTTLVMTSPAINIDRSSFACFVGGRWQVCTP